MQAPRFEVDPLWPKPLPNHWILGQTIGVSVDAQDHIWIIHRARFARSRRAACEHQTRRSRNAALRRRLVLEFDQEGNLIGHWGGPGTGYDWPDSNHGITVDYKGNVWIGGNGRGHPPGAGRASDGSRMKSPKRGAGPADCLHNNDTMVLKFTQDGKFLMQIGKPGRAKAATTSRISGWPAKIFVDQKTNEALRRRRLRQSSRHRVRRRHRQSTNATGALTATSRTTPNLGPTIRMRRPRSSSAIRCTAPSSRSTICCMSAIA